MLFLAMSTDVRAINPHHSIVSDCTTIAHCPPLPLQYSVDSNRFIGQQSYAWDAHYYGS